MGKYRKLPGRLLMLLALSVLLGILAPFGRGAAPTASAAASGKKTNYWLTKNQKVYYIGGTGKRTTGLVKIGKRQYYFDSKGIQRTGWQKIGDYYYYFKIANGKKGYLVADTTVNGIKLNKKGRAKVTSANTSRIQALIRANQIVESITKPTMTKSEKLRLCFDYCIKQLKYKGSPAFYYSASWEVSYALDMLAKGRGNCYAYGATFAFLANAAGYKDCYAVSSGGHGWAEVDGKVYDPSWHLIDTRHSYYAVPMSLSGVDGRPNYKRARLYVAKI